MIGEQVGNFRVVSILGQGGMGVVYLAEQVNVQTKVAIKILLPNISADKDHVQRFFNEAIAVSRIKHAGIVKIFDAGFLPTGHAYLIMELLDGESLASRIRRTGRLSIGSLAEIGRQIASVLEATHQAGITHRDLKPDNIFLVSDVEMTTGERVKILDFGIAKLAGANLTATSAAMGTPAYMAPEQWHNAREVDWRADAYSLGCLTFEMAAGRPPFIVHSIAAAYAQHVNDPPPRLRSIVADAPIALDGLIAQLLEKQPERRPASLKDIAQVFAQLGRDQPAVLDSTMPADAIEPVPAEMVPAETVPSPSPKPVPVPVPVLQKPVPVPPKPVPAPTPKPSPGPAPRKRIIGLASLLVLPAAIVGFVILERRHPNPHDPDNHSPVAPLDAAIADSATSQPISDQRNPPADAAAWSPATVDMHPLDLKALTGCDQIACVVNNYKLPCCASFRRGSNQVASPPAATLTLDSAVVAEGIGRVKSQVMACRDKFPGVTGMVAAAVDVSPDGQVTNVTVRATHVSLVGTGLAGCVQAAMQRASFAKTPSGGSFVYPFSF